MIDRFGSSQAAVAAMNHEITEALFATTVENRYVQVEFSHGTFQWLYRGDFLSGAVIRNIVDAAKKFAIKDQLDSGEPGIRFEHLQEAVRAEFEDQVEVPQMAEVEDVLASKNIRQPIANILPVSNKFSGERGRA